MERTFYRFKGEYEGLEDGESYPLSYLASVTGLKSITIRERLVRRNARGVVRPRDLAEVGAYEGLTAASLSLCETEAEVFSQKWLSKRLVGVSRAGCG